MKKIGAAILIILLCAFIWAGATAAPRDEGLYAAAPDEAFAAYSDGNGNIYMPGNPDILNTIPAKRIISTDGYNLFFLSDNGDLPGDLYMLNFADFKETMLAEGVYTACAADESTLYYVPDEARTQLMRVNIEDFAHETAYTALEPIDRMYLSAEGLVICFVEQAGAMIYIPETGNFELYSGIIPDESMLFDDYELYLTADNDLFIKAVGSYSAEQVDAGVLAFARLEDNIYYLVHTGSAVRLKSYNPEEMTWQVVLTPEIDLENQLVASAGSLYTLSFDGTLYEVDPEQNALIPIRDYSDLSAFDIPENFSVSALEICAMSSRLNVYAILEEEAAQPDFTFIEFDSVVENTIRRTMLLDSIIIEGEEEAWNLLKPADLFTPLSKGSRGEAVSAIQQPLLDLGYYDYRVDGIFGSRTQYAVRLLQSDLNRAVNGIADEELQRIILSGKLSAYDPYLPLTRGNKGMRVQIMQSRLRELGYLADAADGIYGSRTQKAVQLFQSENGLITGDGASRSMLMALYDENAARCSSYIDLYQGDTGYRVRELNNRLMQLYYLQTGVGSTYTQQTATAIRLFQQEAGLPQTGEASQSVQVELFSKYAPEAPGYVQLQRGDENSRVKELQLRLKELNYFSGNASGYYGSSTQKAVKLFQQKAGLNTTGIANVRTQEVLFADDAPVYVKPTVIGVPEISLDYYDYRSGGVFFIEDDTPPAGQITFSWSAEGDVKNYNVRIQDDKKKEYVNNDTLLTRTGVSLNTLEYGKVYTITITAYPEDGDKKHITGASLSFTRVKTPEAVDPDAIGEVEIPVISVSTVDYISNGVQYILPGTVTFKWYAEGQVASYLVEIRDISEEILLSTNTTDEKASIRSTAMNDGEIYTLSVHAIPKNGTIKDAKTESLRFALPEIALPTPSPTPVAPAADVSIPEISIEPAVEIVDGVTYVQKGKLSLSWESTGSVKNYYVEILDAAEKVQAYTTTEKNSLELTPKKMVEGEIYRLNVTAVPVNGTVDDGAFASAEFALYVEPEPEATPKPLPEISAPVIDFESVEAFEDGISYIGGDSIIMNWTADGEIGSYYAEILNDLGGVAAHTETQSTRLSVKARNMDEGVVYTLRVTAIPAGGTIDDGKSSTALFARYVASETLAEKEPEPAIVPTEESQEKSEAEPTEEPEAEPTENPLPEVSAPEIAFESVEDIIDGISYISGGSISMKWTADGDISGYYVEILNDDQGIVAETLTESSKIAFKAANLDEGMVYTLRVTSIPRGGVISDGKSNETQFALFAAEESAEESNEESINVPVTKAEPAPEAKPEPVTETTPEPTPIPLPEISAPVIEFENVESSEDGVNMIGSERISMNWSADGDISGYYVEILNADGGIIADTSVESTRLSLPAENMEFDVVYTLRVTAIPAGGVISDGKSASAQFARYIALTPEPTAEPTPEPTAEPTPEPTPEPVPEEVQLPDAADVDWSVTVDADADPGVIALIQNRLIEWGWLEEEAFESGILDEATVSAIEAFQAFYNANYEPAVNPYDAELASIEADTLAVLMNAEELIYSNPEAE